MQVIVEGFLFNMAERNSGSTLKQVTLTHFTTYKRSPLGQLVPRLSDYKH